MARNRTRWLAGGLSGVITAAYLALVPRGQLAHIDHLGFLETLRRMRGGQGYYLAMRDTFWADWGVRLGGPRSYRMPYVFEILRFVPPGLLLATFAVVVVIGTSVLLADATPRPLAVLPVTVFLLVAGRNPGAGGIEAWMLLELWTVPLLALSYWGWRKDRPWVAASAAAAASLVRELAFPVLLLGLLLAWRRGEPKRPWVVATAVALGGMALHAVLVLGVGTREGTEATLLGTGELPRSVVAMLLFGWPLGLGLIPWVLAGIRIGRARLLAPVSAVLAIPLLGVMVDRPYWGILATPFVLLWAGELVGDVWSERATAPAGQPPAMDHAGCTMERCSDPRPARSPTRPAPTSSRTPTAG